MAVCISLYADRLFYPINVKDGLSDPFVSSIARDHNGYMWFATLNGVDRYDGYHFTRYSRQQLGYTYDTFNQIYADGGSNIWAISAEAIMLYNPAEDCLTDNLDAILKQMGIKNTKAEHLSVDQDGNLWILSDSLYKYDYRTQILSSRQKPQTGISYIACQNGKSYILTKCGVIENDGAPINAISPEIASCTKMYIDTKNRVWVFCPRSNIIICHDPIKGTWTDYGGNTAFKGDFINAIVDDRQGHLWFGTNSNGIIVTDYELNDFENIAFEDKQFSLPNNHINCLYPDYNGMIWIGTSKRGLAFCPLNTLQMDLIAMDADEDISTIMEDRYGMTYVALDGKGFILIDKTGAQKHYTMSNSNLPSNSILGGCLDSEGHLYFSTYGCGIFEWDGEKAIIPTFCTDELMEAAKFSREIIEDKHHDLWIKTFNNGIIRLKKDGGWLHYNSTDSELKTNYITTITYSPKNDTLYIGTGMGMYSIGPDRILKRMEFNRYITELFCDSKGYLWISTIDSLYVMDFYRSRTYHITTSDGLSNPNIRAIAEDKSNGIWVTTSNGFTNIMVIDDPISDALSFRCFPYYSEDGTGDLDFCKKAIYCNSQGEMILGAVNRLVKLHPERQEEYAEAKHVRFTGIQVSGQDVCRNWDSEEVVRLSHKDHLVIDVSAMDFKSRHKIVYEYRFSNDDEWVRIDGNRMHFSNINPGIHQLQVRVAGAFRPAFSSLLIDVRPPFWLSKTAWLLYSLIFVMFIALLWIQLKMKSRRVLEMERHEMDEAKMQFFTNICHDLRTPLTLILTPLGKIMEQYKDHPVIHDLRIVERNANTLMNEVNQLLDFRKLDKAKSQYNPRYGNLTSFISQTCEMFGMLFSDNRSGIELDFLKDDVFTEFDPDKMRRILYNLLSNAFKYNPDGGIITVSIRENEDSTVSFSVADNGIGIKDESKPYIFDRFYQEKHGDTSYTGNGIGLHIVKEYVVMHGGTITVCNNEPKGCIFIVTLPLKQTTRGFSEAFANNISFTTTGRPSILIVEDNNDFRKYISGCLSETYDVMEAQDGAVALELLDRFHFDIVITDIMMPVVDGMELCNRIKNDIRISHIPVIMLTAVGDKKQILKGLKEGADEYIIKPFDYDILLLKIERLLASAARNRLKCNVNEEMDITEITTSRIDAQLLEKVIRLIEENLSNTEYSVEDLSIGAGISRSGLYKKLMYITGKSPIEFIRMIRLKKAKAMLDEGETSISQISWSVGISPKLFSKYFKHEFGCLPSEYLHRK